VANAKPTRPASDAAIRIVMATCLGIQSAVPWAAQTATTIANAVAAPLIAVQTMGPGCTLVGCQVVRKPAAQCEMASGSSALHHGHVGSVPVARTRTPLAAA